MALRTKIIAFTVAGVLVACGAVAAVAYSALKWSVADSARARIRASETADKKVNPSSIDTKNKALAEKLASLEPKGVNIVIDTAANKLYLRQGTETTREVKVSCGSGAILPNPNGKEWIFDTPRGEYKIERKLKNPLWYKPDWAFVEEGKEIPKRNSPDRFEAGVLGDYAMGIGSGYFLHGTLYTRMLGRNVTHGCVRIGDEDLKVLYSTVPVGTKVYLY